MSYDGFRLLYSDLSLGMVSSYFSSPFCLFKYRALESRGVSNKLIKTSKI